MAKDGPNWTTQGKNLQARTLELQGKNSFVVQEKSYQQKGVLQSVLQRVVVSIQVAHK